MKESGTVVDGEAATHEIYCCDLCFGIPWRDVNDQTGDFAINDSLECFEDDSVMVTDYHPRSSSLLIEVTTKVFSAFYALKPSGFSSLQYT